jgi:hypothetical protein
VACIAGIVAGPTGVETELSGLELAAGLFTRPAEVAAGFLVQRGDSDGGAITRAQPAGQWAGVTTGSLDPRAGLLRHHGRGDDPAEVASCGAITREPVATRACFRDEAQVWGLGGHRATEGSKIGLPGAAGAEVDHLSVVSLGAIGHGAGVVVDIPPEVKRARLVPG